MMFLPPEWAVQWSQIFGTLGSLVLSLLLVLLYKRQQEQLAADNTAWLMVGDVRWEDDDIEIKISNLGNGVAANLRLVTLIYTETGEHRNFCTVRHGMKRPDKSGTWGNLIQAGEEDITLTGTSKVGRLIGRNEEKRWRGEPFSRFVRRLKEMGVEEMKFVHVVEGTELSKTRTLARVQDIPVSINPQEYNREHSLENLPSHKLLTNDTTFDRFFLRPPSYRMSKWIWQKTARTINKIAGCNLVPDPVPYASGNGFMKHIRHREEFEQPRSTPDSSDDTS